MLNNVFNIIGSSTLKDAQMLTDIERMHSTSTH